MLSKIVGKIFHILFDHMEWDKWLQIIAISVEILISQTDQSLDRHFEVDFKTYIFSWPSMIRSLRVKINFRSKIFWQLATSNALLTSQTDQSLHRHLKVDFKTYIFSWPSMIRSLRVKINFRSRIFW